MELSLFIIERFEGKSLVSIPRIPLNESREHERKKSRNIRLIVSTVVRKVFREDSFNSIRNGRVNCFARSNCLATDEQRVPNHRA